MKCHNRNSKKTLNYDRNYGHNLVSYKTKTRKNIHDSIKGGRLIYCQECGKLVLSQSKTYPEKYCKKCAKEIEREKTLQRVKKHNERKK